MRLVGLGLLLVSVGAGMWALSSELRFRAAGELHLSRRYLVGLGGPGRQGHGPQESSVVGGGSKVSVLPPASMQARLPPISSELSIHRASARGQRWQKASSQMKHAMWQPGAVSPLGNHSVCLWHGGA